MAILPRRSPDDDDVALHLRKRATPADASVAAVSNCPCMLHKPLVASAEDATLPLFFTVALAAWGRWQTSQGQVTERFLSLST